MEWDFFCRRVQSKINCKLRTKCRRLHKKLKNITPPQARDADFKPPEIIPNFVQNLSTQTITKDEEDLLNKGLQYAIKPKKPPMEDYIMDIEAEIGRLPQHQQKDIRHETRKILAKKFESTTKHKTQLNILKNLRNRNLTYIKADKNNSIIIMDTEDYDKRVIDMLKEGPYTEIRESPLPKLISKVTELTKEAGELLNEKYLNLRLKVSNPRVPVLYALPKTHKPGQKMRPIASNINSPTSKIAKWIINKFKYIKPPESFEVKNSIDLVNKIKGETVKRNEALVSFDVVSLYPSIPTEKAIEYLEYWLLKRKVPANTIKAYVTLTKLCIEESYIQFRGKYYKQTHGVAMGNPVSSFIANLYMSFIEKELSKTSTFPRIWYRYVDDIFAIVNKRKIKSTLDIINTIHPSIKFTVEEEQEKKLNFLEITITRNEQHLNFSIYRKPTHTPRYITSDSFHHIQYKKAAFNSMVNRLIFIPMNTINYKKELNTIYEIASLNGYTNNFINKIVCRTKQRKYLEETTTLLPQKTENKFLSVAFYPPYSNKLANIFKKHNISIVTKSNLKIKTAIENYKDKIEEHQSSGIYEIQCGDCENVYIGQTRRTIIKRFSEHMRATQKKNINDSAVAEHMVSHKHSFGISNLKLIKRIINHKKLDAAESIELIKTKQKTINRDGGPVKDKTLISLVKT